MKQSIFLTMFLVFTFSLAHAQQVSRKGDVKPPKEEYEEVKKDLGLSQKQEKQLKKLYDNQQKEFDKRKTARSNDRPAPANARSGNEKKAPDRDKKLKAKHDEFEADVKKILSDEQFKKWKSQRSQREMMSDRDQPKRK